MTYVVYLTAEGCTFPLISQSQRTDSEADVVLSDAMQTDRDATDLLILVREATEETNSKLSPFSHCFQITNASVSE